MEKIAKNRVYVVYMKSGGSWTRFSDYLYENKKQAYTLCDNVKNYPWMKRHKLKVAHYVLESVNNG